MGIGPGGRLCLAASVGDADTVPGAAYTTDSAWNLSCRNATGQWTPLRTLRIGLRYCYPYLHVNADGSLDLIGTRDVTWEAMGYPQVPGSFGYILDAVDRWHFPTLRDAPARRNHLATPFTTPATNPPFAWQSDSLVDRRGRLHLLTQSRNSSTGVWRMEHRVIEDPYGRLLILFIQSGTQYLYPTLDAGGLELGRRIDRTARLGGGGSSWDRRP